MSVIIIAYSAVQMLAEKILDRVKSAHYRIVMLLFVILAGLTMIIFALSRTTAIVVSIMVLLPLFLSVPAFILDSMENTYIDRHGYDNKRATILSVANMAGNLIEIVFLFASAYIVNIGISVCFIGAGLMMVFFAVLISRRTGTAD